MSAQDGVILLLSIIAITTALLAIVLAIRWGFDRLNLWSVVRHYRRRCVKNRYLVRWYIGQEEHALREHREAWRERWRYVLYTPLYLLCVTAVGLIQYLVAWLSSALFGIAIEFGSLIGLLVLLASATFFEEWFRQRTRKKRMHFNMERVTIDLGSSRRSNPTLTDWGSSTTLARCAS